MRFKTVKGTRDFPPEESSVFNKIIEIIRNVFEKYGFIPLYTPAMESFKLLSAKGGLGEAVKDEIYYFKDKAGREIGLRFDLTMPLVRFFISNKPPLPFKRYQIGKVWRYDEPQRLRYREFWQADIDIIGSPSILADVECLACVCECLEKLGFRKFFIRINDRKIVDKILDLSGVKKRKRIKVMRILDKIERFGKTKIVEELNKMGVNGKKIIDSVRPKNIDLKVLMPESKDLIELIRYSKKFGIKKRLKVDLSLVRGLEYYTGLVYEIFLGEKVSCGGGGRYDKLIETIGGPPTPATGVSLGLDRIFQIMKEREMMKISTKTKVFVANVNEKAREEAIKTAQKLRESGIGCEIDIMNRNLSKQLKYANKIGVSYVIIIGEKEMKEKKLRLKNMKEKSEKILKFEDIVKIVKGKNQ
jgi:histidyl-tRNA synthetase